MPVIKFTYFDIEAKGELTRLLLHAGNFDFEDNRIPRSEWPGELKRATTFGQLPMLCWDGIELAQSMAIVRLVIKSETPGLSLFVCSDLFMLFRSAKCHSALQCHSKKMTLTQDRQ